MAGAANTNGTKPPTPPNYLSYLAPSDGRPRVGHLDFNSNKVQPLAFASGTPLSNLYQLIEVGKDNVIPTGHPIDLSSVKVLPPISGRDVLCVGKNYSDHAKEFNSSGFDSSDKTDIPTHPVIFTKRATSIIADKEEIYPHPNFTETLDFEGEIGVIIGKAGFRIGVDEAMEYVWGYTIINDMTARERQRDHKQFYIGKSPDTFCPMGPVAVPKEYLPEVLRVQTHVNGVKKQDSTTEKLIFSIPFLIMTLSEGQTLQRGDVLATGTPAGVGIGKTPPQYLKAGDKIDVSVTGLGTLSNTISPISSVNATLSQIEAASSMSRINFAKSCYGIGLADINVFFVHGLGGTSEYFGGLYDVLQSSSNLHSFDLEGHGLSPTWPTSKLSISSFASDLQGLFAHTKVTSGATIIAHSMGCLVALKFAMDHPASVKNLILMGPPPSPLPDAGSKASLARAALAREQGMAAVVDSVASAGTSSLTKTKNPTALAAVRLSLLGQDPEGYAKACSALAGATDGLELSKLQARTLILTGDEDKVSAPDLCKKNGALVPNCVDVEVLANVGHWHMFENPERVVDAVQSFMQHS